MIRTDARMRSVCHDFLSLTRSLDKTADQIGWLSERGVRVGKEPEIVPVWFTPYNRGVHNWYLIFEDPPSK